MNRQIIQLYKQAYKESFEKIHKQEIYKWKAVQVFQENWDINADDFAGMLEKSLSKTGNLLDSNNTFPRKMAISNSEKSPFEMRELFKRLFNEEDDVIDRFDEDIESLAIQILQMVHYGRILYLDDNGKDIRINKTITEGFTPKTI